MVKKVRTAVDLFICLALIISGALIAAHNTQANAADGDQPSVATTTEIANPLAYFGISFNGVNGTTIKEVKKEIETEFPHRIITMRNEVKPFAHLILGYKLPRAKQGSHFTNTLPDIFEFTSDTDFDLIVGGSKVGTIHLNAANKTITSTLSQDVEASEYVFNLQTPMSAQKDGTVAHKKITMQTTDPQQSSFDVYYVNPKQDKPLQHTLSFNRNTNTITTIVDLNRDYSLAQQQLTVKVDQANNAVNSPKIQVASYDKTVDSKETNVISLDPQKYTFKDGVLTILNPQREKQYKVSFEYPIKQDAQKTSDIKQTVTVNNDTTLTSEKVLHINYDKPKHEANSELLKLSKIAPSSFSGWRLEIDGHAKNDTVPIDTITLSVKTTDTDTNTVIKGNKINFNNFGQVEYATTLNEHNEWAKNNILNNKKSISDVFTIEQSEDEHGIVTAILKLKNPSDAHNAYVLEFNTSRCVPGNTVSVTIQGKKNIQKPEEQSDGVNKVSDSVRLVLKRAQKKLKETIFEKGVAKYNIYNINISAKKHHVISDLYIDDMPGRCLEKEIKKDYIIEVSGTGYVIGRNSTSSKPFTKPTVKETHKLTVNDFTLTYDKEHNKYRLHLDKYDLLNTPGYESKLSIELKIPIDQKQVPDDATEYTTTNEAYFDFIEYPQNADGASGKIARVNLKKESEGERPILTDRGVAGHKWSIVAKQDASVKTNRSQIVNMIVTNGGGRTLDSISFNDTTEDSVIVPNSAKIIAKNPQDFFTTENNKKADKWKQQNFESLKALYQDAEAQAVEPTINGKNLQYSYQVPEKNKGKAIVLLYKTETNDKWYNDTKVTNKATVIFNKGGDGNVVNVDATATYELNEKIITKQNTTDATSSKVQSWKVVVNPGEHFSDKKRMVNPVIKDELSQPEQNALVNTFIPKTLKIINQKNNTEYTNNKDYTVQFDTYNRNFTIAFTNGKNIVDPVEITINTNSSTSNTFTNTAVVENFEGLNKENSNPQAATPEALEANKQIPIEKRTAQESKTVAFTEGGTTGKVYVTKLFIKKTDQFNNPIANVSFTVTNISNPKETYTLTTDTIGAAEHEMPTGTYHIVEDAKTVHHPYTLNTKIADITLKKINDLKKPTENEIKTNTAVVINKQTSQISIQAKKELEGRKLQANEFVFELKDAKGTKIAEAKNQADGKIVFTADALTYDAVGKYEYTVVEKQDAKIPGVAYDNAEKKIIVETKLNDNKVLEAKQVTSLSEATFHNRFTPVTVQIVAKKELKGRELNKHEFCFVLNSEKSKTTVAKACNEQDGTVRFVSKSLSFTTPGVYAYSIEEKLDNQIPNITYDTSKKNVYVHVTVDEHNQLQARLAAQANDSNAVLKLDALTFTNVYHEPEITDEDFESERDDKQPDPNKGNDAETSHRPELKSSDSWKSLLSATGVGIMSIAGVSLVLMAAGFLIANMKRERRH